MSVLTPVGSALALACVGLLMIIFALAMTGRLIRYRRTIQRALLRSFKVVARLVDCLGSLIASAVTASARDASVALPVAVEVLVEDRELRERALRHAQVVLTRCIAAIGSPPANCAVLIVRGLERDGRPMNGCVERLACTDGTSRTIIALALGEGPGVPSFDTIAARLAGYYLVATGAERTILSSDAPPAPANPAASMATRLSPPQPIGLRTLPAVTEAKRA